jgi:uncharacterized protein (TIGR04255 family)
MTYKKNFINQVIVRCDVVDKLPVGEGSALDELKQELRRIGPVQNQRRRIAGGVRITPEGVQTEGKLEEAPIWDFTDKERQRKVTISDDMFLIEYRQFESFSQLKQDFENLINIVKKHLGDFSSRRLGLRYIDIFPMGEGSDPLDWDAWITPDFLVTGEHNRREDREFLSRAFNKLEYTYDDSRVIIQYGIHNPAYPSPIKARQYILDTDVSSRDVIDSDELISLLSNFEIKAKRIFEAAITAKTRDYLNA